MASNPPASARGRTTSVWIRRLLLLVLGPTAVIGALEGGLRLGGFGQAETLFVPDAEPGFYRTNPAFTLPYFPAHFDLAPLDFRIPAKKPAGHVRIFVLGESAARGVPEPAFGFAPLVRAELLSAYPGKTVEVYDLGIVAINSHAVLETARAAARFLPDLFIVYAGNNEVIGPFGPGSANLDAMPPLAVIRTALWVRRTRLGQLFERLAGIWAEGRPKQQWRGMATFLERPVAGDDPRLAAVYHNFSRNLDEIARVAEGCGAKMVLATVATNLRDCPPFGTRHRPGLTSKERDSWERDFAAGKYSWECGDWADAEASLRAAVATDEQAADGHYLLGLVLDHRQDWAGAREHFRSALHWDSIRFRPDAEINATIRAVAKSHPGAVQLVDVAAALGSDPTLGYGPSAGREILWEHVHLNWSGNRLTAHLLAVEGGEALFGKPTAPWPDEEACGRAVGLTPFGQLRVLRALGPIISNPPFTNQLSYADDQVRFQRLNEVATDAARAPGAVERARRLVSTAIASDPENAELRLRLAEIEFEGGRPNEALTALDAATSLLPASAPLQIRRGRTLLALNRAAEAEAEDLQALRTDPDHLPAYTELEAATRQTKHFDATDRVLSHAIERNPGSDYLHLTLADLWFDRGRPDDAAAACRAVLAANPASAEALARLESLDRATGKLDEAIMLMTQALDTQPHNFGNAMALAGLLEQRHDAEGLARCLLVATRGGPASAKLHLYLAHLWEQQGDASRARLEVARARRTALLAGHPETAERIDREFETVR